MTDHELKGLIASLSLAQRKTDEQQAKTEVEIKKLLRSQQKTDEQLAKTDAQLARTDARLDRLATMYGGVANNQGVVAEAFYFNSLKHNLVLRGIHFDSIYKNLASKRHGIEDEYDILLLNGQDVLIIEVKYKAHPDDLKVLIDKKAVNFKPLFPLYKDHNLHLGLASFYLDNETIQSALNQGITVLQRKGDLIETTPATPFH